MAQLAKVQLLNATIGRDAETKQTPSGTTLLKFPVAVNHRGSDGQDVATWYEVTIWGKQAETLAGFNLSKGTRVCVDGRLKPRSYQGRQGDTRISLDVDATDVIVVSPKSESCGVPFGNLPQKQDDNPFNFRGDTMDQVPF